MKHESRGQKPRVTDLDALKAIVEELRHDGMQEDEIQRRIVSVAIVDLDDLNEVLKAA